ncbi:Arc family DNA-binding protein [Allomesorhizobium camelthorni]|uniref:Arc family DNA-binding protein n=1 Tax=Allomesorhizobium camelthorni TaxID=475069 RepID=A0A6G4W6V1_9HYPH|nr:Arc family DNA-binding protein [Mesorhizobium camelthorni]NGO50472.1 Arc family DNA-binding protein [Mesorhizobium camelthorni]
MPQPDKPSFHLRLTPALRKRIRVAAAENERSINAEIAARLERSFSPDDEDRSKAVRLLTDALSILDKGGTG